MSDSSSARPVASFESLPEGDANSAAGIEVQNLTVSYTSAVGKGEEAPPVAVLDASFSVSPGEFVAIVGPSGCGKSTILKTLAGLLKPSAGSTRIFQPNGEEPRLGFMFQSDALLPWRTALGNIELAVRLSGESASVATERAVELMEELGLAGSGNKYPGQLSGGMRKRVSLARALAYRPSVYLMDEPFGALDAMTRIQVGNFCLRVFDRVKATVVFVTHDIDEAVAMADRVIVMASKPGRIVGDYEVPLARPRDYHETRFAPGFYELQQQVWDGLAKGGSNVTGH